MVTVIQCYNIILVFISFMEIDSDIVFFLVMFCSNYMKKNPYWMIWMVVSVYILETWNELYCNFHPLPEKHAPWNMVTLYYYLPHLICLIVSIKESTDVLFIWQFSGTPIFIKSISAPPPHKWSSIYHHTLKLTSFIHLITIYNTACEMANFNVCYFHFNREKTDGNIDVIWVKCVSRVMLSSHWRP